MNLATMRTLVRRDLHDEDAVNYRWTNDEIDRHIAHAVKDFSGSVPLEQRVMQATTAGSREIDISSLADRIHVAAVEYPVGRYPPYYQRYSLWEDTLKLLGAEVPDGSNACIYYGKLHTLDTQTSTIPMRHEDLIATGACGYAAIEWAINAVNRINTGGAATSADLLRWGKEKLAVFQAELKRLGRKNKVRVQSLYVPYAAPVSKSTDPGP